MVLGEVEKQLSLLIADGEVVLATRFERQAGGTQWVDAAKSMEWALVSARFIRLTWGDESEHYRTIESERGRAGFYTNAETIQATLRAALVGLQRGHVHQLRALIRADVESDLIGQAQDLLASGYDRAAAVVAGCILETHLRDIAPSWAIAVTDPKGKPLTLEPLNQALKKAGAYDGIMQKRITLVGGLRNEAAHGGPFNATASDVGRMIHDVLDACDRVKAR